jgi:hypothetical protein
MIDPLPIPDELWAKVPPDARAASAAVFLAMRPRVDEWETRVGDLEARRCPKAPRKGAVSPFRGGAIGRPARPVSRRP